MPPFQISRRSFFKRAALAAAATGIPPWFVAQSLDAAEPTVPTLANDKPNIALIGCGGMGRGNANLASAFANVVAVCDVDSKRAGEASAQFGGARVFSDFRRLLE